MVLLDHVAGVREQTLDLSMLLKILERDGGAREDARV